jgi:hypothetical protein
MATTIYFVGGELPLEVAEEPDEVHTAFNDQKADGVVKLTVAGGEVTAYVLPSAIAYWRAKPGPGKMHAV